MLQRDALIETVSTRAIKLQNTLELFDSHFHIIDPRFPLVPNNGYFPEAFSCKAYLQRLSNYRLIGGAIVSGSFQAFDQTYLLPALQSLGPDFVGVTQLPFDAPDHEIMALHAAGVRAIRFNLYQGRLMSARALAAMANRVYALAGWHSELYVDASDLESMSTLLAKLPAVSIDHLGISKAGLPQLLKLAEKGVKIKATGFGRLDFDAAEAIVPLYNANPDSLLFGTDLPSTRATVPFQNSDIAMIVDLLGDVGARKVLRENGIQFYGVGENG